MLLLEAEYAARLRQLPRWHNLQLGAKSYEL